MLRLGKVAVTGGLSSGKSTVCRILKELGAYVVSADEIVHQLLSPETKLGQQVIQLIGPEIVIGGEIDRSEIAKKVFNLDSTSRFNQQALLKSLEGLLHPAVREEIERQYKQCMKESVSPLFVAEIPLLFETNGDAGYDYTIAVVSDPEACLKRFTASTGYGKKEFHQRMARQLSPEEKARRADFTIFNHGSLEELRANVKKVYDTMINPTIKESGS